MAKNNAALHAVGDEQTQQPTPERRTVTLSPAKTRLIESINTQIAALNAEATGIIKGEAAEAGFDTYHARRDPTGAWVVVEGPAQ